MLHLNYYHYLATRLKSVACLVTRSYFPFLFLTKENIGDVLTLSFPVPSERIDSSKHYDWWIVLFSPLFCIPMRTKKLCHSCFLLICGTFLFPLRLKYWITTKLLRLSQCQRSAFFLASQIFSMCKKASLMVPCVCVLLSSMEKLISKDVIKSSQRSQANVAYSE